VPGSGLDARMPEGFLSLADALFGRKQNPHVSGDQK